MRQRPDLLREKPISDQTRPDRRSARPVSFEEWFVWRRTALFCLRSGERTCLACRPGRLAQVFLSNRVRRDTEHHTRDACAPRTFLRVTSVMRQEIKLSDCQAKADRERNKSLPCPSPFLPPATTSPAHLPRKRSPRRFAPGRRTKTTASS